MADINTRLSPDGGEVVRGSVTVEGWGSGSDLDCFSHACLEPPAITVYNPDVLGVYLVFIISHMMANRGWVFLIFFESLFEGSFRFADVTGFKVLARQLVIALLGHSMSDQPMVCESPLRFRWKLAHVQIMHKNKSVQIFRDVGQAVSEIWPSKKWKKGRFLRQDPSVKCQ